MRDATLLPLRRAHSCLATIAEYGPVAALAAATLLMMPGPLDPDAFATGREAGLLGFVALSLACRLAVDEEVSLDAADGWALASFAWLIVAALYADIRPLVWRSAGLVTATTGLWLVVRRSSTHARTAVLPWTILVLATVVAAVSWCEAMGWLSSLSQAGRSPGGLFGNRNRMAHVLALSLPTVVAVGLGARQRVPRALALIALAGVTSMLVVARSRAAWVGSMVGLASLGVGFFALRRDLRVPIAPARFVLALVALGCGWALALGVPTSLRWRAAHPYRESVRTLTNLRDGSGRARVVQQRNTSRMILDAPLLGVGPGGWHVAYAKFSTPGDSTYIPHRRSPTNRLPHGDWLGIAAELGIPGLLAVLGFFAVVADRLLRDRVQDGADAPPGTVLGRIAALATLLTLLVLGLSDPVFMTPGPAAISIAVLGAWTARGAPLRRWRVGPGGRSRLVASAMLICGVPLVFAIRLVYGDFRRRAAVTLEDLTAAALWSVADFDSRLAVSEAWVRAGRCDRAVPYAIEAFRLDPSSAFPPRVLARCGAISDGPRSTGELK